MEQGACSRNEAAEKIVGKRDIEPGDIIFDAPCELGYKCPVCMGNDAVKDPGPNEGIDERHEWSEYNGFLWCSKCNFDYPSALCQPDPKKATEIYLQCVLDAQKFRVAEDSKIKKSPR